MRAHLPRQARHVALITASTLLVVLGPATALGRAHAAPPVVADVGLATTCAAPDDGATVPGAPSAMDASVSGGAPSVPLSVGRGTTFATGGSIAPLPQGSPSVSISCYRLQSVVWTLKQSLAARLASTSDGATYSLTLSLPAAGTWRLRACWADAAGTTIWSAWSRTVRVGAGPDLPIWNRDGRLTVPERMASRANAAQLLVATGPAVGARYGSLRLFSYRAGDWRLLLSVAARFGWAGLADGRTRREGAGTTPTGIWLLPHFFFGMHARPPAGAKMPYRRITQRSWWSKADNATYNTWVQSSRPIPGEHLADAPLEYEFAVSSGYNAPPNACVYGRGTAIFVHINGPGLTAGCVSVARPAMIRLCRWLDPGKRPACAIGTTRGGGATSIYAY